MPNPKPERDKIDDVIPREPWRSGELADERVRKAAVDRDIVERTRDQVNTLRGISEVPTPDLVELLDEVERLRERLAEVLGYLRFLRGDECSDENKHMDRHGGIYTCSQHIDRIAAVLPKQQEASE